MILVGTINVWKRRKNIYFLQKLKLQIQCLLPYPNACVLQNLLLINYNLCLATLYVLYMAAIFIFRTILSCISWCSFSRGTVCTSWSLAETNISCHEAPSSQAYWHCPCLHLWCSLFCRGGSCKFLSKNK